MPRTVRRTKFCKSLGTEAKQLRRKDQTDRVSERRSKIPCTTANAMAGDCAWESYCGYIFLECTHRMHFKIHFQIFICKLVTGFIAIFLGHGNAQVVTVP